MRTIWAICLLLLCTVAMAVTPHEQRMIDKGKPLFPLVNWAFETAWPDAPMRSFVAAQAEKESLWNPQAVLCVPKPSCSREKGMGLGQFTITKKFNAFREVSLMHPLLRDWSPEEYTDPRKQALAMVVKNRSHYLQCTKLMRGVTHVMACVASSYNGGYGGFVADRRLCGNTIGCDPELWFGHVAETSLKAKKPLEGYGQSFYQINRGYAKVLVFDYRLKYVPYLGN